MPVIKLTKREIDKIKPQGRDMEFWDAEDQGFYLKVTPAGKKVFYFFYRNKYGQKRKLRLGDYGPLTPTDARKKFIEAMADVQGGNDPAAEKKQAKQASTFDELANKYLEEYARVHKKPRSVKDDEYNLERFLRKTFGKHPVAAITRADVLRFHHSLRETPVPANRCLALLSRMFNLAEAWGIRPDGSNPCQHVKKYPETKRERYLDGSELTRIAQAIDELERKWNTDKPRERDPEKKEKDDRISPAAAAALRLLILTGCRCGEILSLQWAYVDLEDKCLRLPDSKTGAKIIYLNDAAVEVLKNLTPDPSGWVIPGQNEGQQMVNLHKPWKRVLTKAKIAGVRLHDLRHSYASVAAGLNLGLPIIGKLLGHTHSQTTHRYAHLMDDPLRAAAAAIGKEIADAMNGKGAKVVELLAERTTENANPAVPVSSRDVQ